MYVDVRGAIEDRNLVGKRGFPFYMSITWEARINTADQIDWQAYSTQTGKSMALLVLYVHFNRDQGRRRIIDTCIFPLPLLFPSFPSIPCARY